MSEELNADMREVAKRLDAERRIRRLMARLALELITECLLPWQRIIAQRVMKPQVPRLISEGKE